MGPDLSLHPDPDVDGSIESLVQRLTHRRFAVSHPRPEEARAAALAAVGEARDQLRLFRVRDGAAERGHVWLMERPGGEDVSLAGLTLDDHRLAWGVRSLVVEVARADGYRRLVVAVPPGDPVLEEFERGGGFVVMATHMALDLDHPLPPAGELALQPMDDRAFAAWEAAEVATYATELVAAGATPAAAARRSEEEHERLLPDGKDTPDNHFFVGLVDGEQVSILWLSTRDPMVFVYDVVVDEAHRGQGHGSATMRAAALWAQARDAHAVGLNVFGHNTVARRLYDGLGYHVTETFVARPLAQLGPLGPLEP